MGNCACEKTQQVQSNVTGFPPQIIELFSNLKQQIPIDLDEEFDIRDRDTYIKQMPSGFKELKTPVQALKKFEFQDFQKETPLKGPTLFHQADWIYVYYGQMDGKQKKGNGIIISQEGSYYQGQWKNDNPHGFGRMVNEFGEIYEGFWIFGCIEGDGVQYRQNLKQKGIWMEGELNGLGEENLIGEYFYHGNFKNGQKHGKGEITFEIGDTYQGDFQNNLIQGIGKYTWSDGQIYEGSWIESQMHGKGVYTFPDGTKFEGFYHMGERHGKGIVHFSNKQFYKSNWVLGIDSTARKDKENVSKDYIERRSKL